MFQTVTVGSGVTTLRWDMAYQNHSGGFNAGSQYLAVNVRDPATDAILATLFKTTQGIDPQQAPMQTYAVDISAFAGQTVRIDVELQGQNFFFDATFDNFKLL